MLKRRKSNRLKGFDYFQSGCYFITICTNDRECLFGDVMGDNVLLNEYGKIVNDALQSVGTGLAPVRIHSQTIMPNHVHLIVEITNPDTYGQGQAGQGQALSLPDVVREIKSRAAVNILNVCKSKNVIAGKIWQRSYHDHIIRNKQEYERIWQYIDNNPSQWELDCHNSINPKYKDWSVANHDK